MDNEKERLKILEMIDLGQISVQEGLQLLEALAGEDQAETEPVAEQEPPQLAEKLEGEINPHEAAPSEFAPQPAPLEPPVPEAQPKPEPAAHPETSPAEDTEAAPAEQEPAPFASDPEILAPDERFDPSKLSYRHFWWIPMWVGIGILLIGALLMYWAWSASGFGFWFACTWFPFLLGVAIMALAWSSRTARWLHVRVHQKPGEKPEKIAISLPIPLRLTAWFLRMFGNKIPHMEGTSLDEIILALDATSPEAPFYVEVNEGEDGERVEVYIG